MESTTPSLKRWFSYDEIHPTLFHRDDSDSCPWWHNPSADSRRYHMIEHKTLPMTTPTPRHLASLTAKQRHFETNQDRTPGSLFNKILPYRERHLLVKVIDQILHRLAIWFVLMPRIDRRLAITIVHDARFIPDWCVALNDLKLNEQYRKREDEKI